LAQQKKILISLPDSLLQEVDEIVTMEKRNRSEFIRESMRLYLRERRKIKIREELKAGYQMMGGLNRELAEKGLAVDGQALALYERLLKEQES
jgi:CopG family transcriptional regulator/antitoxin EndoAI